jgi:hypothetical protein
MSNLQLVSKFLGKAVNDTIIDLGSCNNHKLIGIKTKQIWDLTEADVNNVANVIRDGSYPAKSIITKFNLKFLAK